MILLPVLSVLCATLAAAAPTSDDALFNLPRSAGRLFPRDDPDQPVSTMKRRRTHNCGQKDELKSIEAQAWADAGELAKAANEWEATVTWQTAMDLYMGPESAKSDYAYKIYSKFKGALENQNKIHHPNWIFPEAVVEIYCGDTNPKKKVCIEKQNPRDPNGPLVTPFASSWVSRGVFYNTYNVVLCPRFFNEKRSLQSLLNDFKSGRQDGHDATNYKQAWGHTIFHELMHLDPVIANDEIWDIVYGACPVRKLAHNNGCSGGADPKNPPWRPRGWNYDRVGAASSMNNADSWTFFADAVYYQKALGYKDPGVPVNDCGIYGAADANITDWEPLSVEGIREPDELAFQLSRIPGRPKPENLPADPPSVPQLPYEAEFTPEGLAEPFDAVAYFATYTPPTKSAPPTTTTPASSIPTNACDGNQVIGDCEDGVIPESTGGVGCLRPAVNGGNKNHVRYNTADAASAVTTYCSNLIKDKVVLDKDHTNIRSGSAPGAENGGSVSLTVLYTDDYCMNSRTPGKLDFAAMGQSQCEQAFNQISQACSAGPEFPEYSEEFKGMGGVAGFMCAIWSVQGLP